MDKRHYIALKRWTRIVFVTFKSKIILRFKRFPRVRNGDRSNFHEEYQYRSNKIFQNVGEKLCVGGRGKHS